jgi:hypothetical protein
MSDIRFRAALKELSDSQLKRLEAALVRLQSSDDSLEELLASLRSSPQPNLSADAEQTIGARTYELMLADRELDNSAARARALDDYASGRLDKPLQISVATADLPSVTPRRLTRTRRHRSKALERPETNPVALNNTGAPRKAEQRPRGYIGPKGFGGRKEPYWLGGEV